MINNDYFSNVGIDSVGFYAHKIYVDLGNKNINSN